MQNSEKRRFIDDECCPEMDVAKEIAMAVFACVVMRDMYAARTAGACVSVLLPATSRSYIQCKY